MASAGKSAGRVSIRVVPDTTKFRDELKASLTKIERGLNVNISAVLDRAKFDEQLKRLTNNTAAGITIQSTLATAKVKEELKKLSADQKVELKADLDTRAVKPQLAFLSRNRFVDLAVRLNKASLVQVGTALAALSGARGAFKPLQSLGTYLANLDKNVPRIAAVSLAVANIGSLALGSLGGVLQLAAGLTQVVGVAALAPAIFGALGTSMAVLTVALKDAPKALASLKPAFQGLQKTISGNFWDAATKPIRDMVDTLLPGLKKGLGDVSTSLGGFAGSFASALQSALSGPELGVMFTNLATAIGIASQGLSPLVSAIVRVGAVGSSWLPGLAKGFTDLANRFNSFIQGAAKDGSLVEWIQNGISALKTLGSIAGSAVSILGGLFAAAQGSNAGNGLTSFAAALKTVAGVINGPAFQVGLRTIFSGAAAGISGLATAIGPISKMFSALAPVIASVMATAGQAVGQLLGQLATALSSPAFSKGLGSLFTGIAAGLAGIGPALPAVVTAFGAIASIAGTLAANLGGVLGAAFQALAPIVVALATALQPLIPVLGQALVGAMVTLAPAVMQIVNAFAGQLGPIIATIVPIIGQLAAMFAALLPTLLPLIPLLGGLLITALTTLAPLVLQLVAALGPLVPILAGALVTAIQTLLPVIVQIVAAIGANLAPVITQIVAGLAVLAPQLASLLTALIPLIPTVLQLAAAFIGFAVQVQSGLTPVMGSVTSIMGVVVGVIRLAVGAISATLSTLAAIFSGNFGQALSILTGWKAQAIAIVDSFTGGALSRFTAWVSKTVTAIGQLPGRAKAALGNMGNTLYSAGADLVKGFISGIGSQISAVAGEAAKAAQAAIDAAKRILKIKSPSRVFHEIGRYTVEGFVNGIDSSKSSVDQRISNLVDPSLVATPSRLNVTGLTGAAPAAAGGMSFGNVYGLSAADVAREVIRLMNEREALEFA